MNIENEIAEDLAKELQEVLDWELMVDMMVAVGWTKVELPRFTFNELTHDMNNWMHKECRYHWKRRGKTWIFENKEEAALFKLTWS